MLKAKEDWMTSKWRPMMAVTYMAINICDFILFPILWPMIQAWQIEKASYVFVQWVPLTLQGGGLIHMAFGAILGVTAWTRGQEKIAQVGYSDASYSPNTTRQQNYSYEEPVQENAQYVSDYRKTPVRKRV